MNRELKFRVFDNSTKKMNPVNSIWGFPEVEHITIPFGDTVETLFNNFELMQFTGLKDKKGIEIYEKDIIDGMIVTYCGNQKDGLGMKCGWYLQRNDFESWTELESRHNDNKDNYKIQGNVLENPEMLLVSQAIT